MALWYRVQEKSHISLFIWVLNDDDGGENYDDVIMTMMMVMMMIIMNSPFSRNFSSSTYGSSVNPLGSATGQTEGRSKARRKMQDGRKSIFMLTHRIFVSRILLESSLVLPFFFKFKHHSETTHVRSVSWLNCLRMQFALYPFIKICHCATWWISFDNCVGYNSDDEWHSPRKYLVHGYELKKRVFLCFWWNSWSYFARFTRTGDDVREFLLVLPQLGSF